MKKKTSINDPNLKAKDIVDRIVESSSKNPHAVALGKLGGSKGGKARAKKLSAKRRSEIAKIAVETRWKKNKN